MTPAVMSPVTTPHSLPSSTEISDHLDGETETQKSYSTSMTWVSDEVKERETFFDTLKNLERMKFAGRSPFVPTTEEDWYAHRLSCKEAGIEDMQRKIAFRMTADEAKRRMTDAKAARIQQAFGGKFFNDNRGAVLGLPSIWCPWTVGNDEKPEAPWPTKDEMVFEGDERVCSGFGRFPPLPRVEGNPTVNWKCKAIITGYAFDQVRSLESIHSPTTLATEERMYELLETTLMEQIDE